MAKKQQLPALPAQLIKRILQTGGVSYAQASEALGLPQDHIRHQARHTNPTMETVMRYAAISGVIVVLKVGAWEVIKEQSF